MNLTELIDYLNNEFKQEEIPLDEFDYQNNCFNKKPNPKYLYRGENDFYSATKSNYHRLLDSCFFTNSQLFLFNDYIVRLLIDLMANHLQLVGRDDPNHYPCINEAGGYLQHYGFPIMWLDFTSDINIAAFFASYKNQNRQGRICVTETTNLLNENQIFKLDKSIAKRPTLQKAFALRMFDEKPDLKRANDFVTRWYEFNLTESDLTFQKNDYLLSTKGDRICETILNYIENNKINDSKIQEYINIIKTDLIEKKTGHN